MNELLNRNRTQTWVLRRNPACVIGDVAAHPDHEMLFVALIKKEQIAWLSLIEILANKLTVFLHQSLGRDKSLALTIYIPPTLA